MAPTPAASPTFNVWVEAIPSVRSHFTYIPSPVKGGNLGFIVGLERGAHVWMRGRGQDGLARHAMEGETAYVVGADLPADCASAVGPIATRIEVTGRVATRDVGPLKALVNMLESGFWAFGEEGEVRAVIRGWGAGDGAGEPARAEAVTGSKVEAYEVPATTADPRMPPIVHPARECEDVHDVKHAVVAGGTAIADTPPLVVRSAATLEVFENGFPGGAHASAEVEVRPHVDIRLELRPPGGRRHFLRWTSAWGFDERSRTLLSPEARRRDDKTKTEITSDTEARADQERVYQRELDHLRSIAAGEGAQERMKAEIDHFLDESQRMALTKDEVEKHVAEIKRAYSAKRVAAARQKVFMADLARSLRARWSRLVPSEPPAEAPAAPATAAPTVSAGTAPSTAPQNP